MIRRDLATIASITAGTLHGDPDATVDDIATDTRALPGGDALFVALRGEAVDGHAYAADAIRGGARAVLAERALPAVDAPVVEVADTWLALRALAADERRQVDPIAVAITGSVGKTTVKDLTAAAVGAERRVHAARGSFNNELGVPLTLLGMPQDTQVVVAEIGARHLGDIAALAPIVAPDVAIVTAVAAVHLEVFGDIETIAVAKRELVESLGPDGLAVLQVGDPRVAAMAAAAPAVLRVAIDRDDADVRAEDVVLDRLGRARARALTPWGTVDLELPIAGRHHVGTALLAIAVAGHLGVDLAAAAAALARAPVSPGRAGVEAVGDLVLLDDAYNASPTSVAAALDTLVAIERSGATWAVLGEMAEIGDTAADEHRTIGARCAAIGVDNLVVVGASAAGLAAGAQAAGGDVAVTCVDDPAAAAELVVAGAGPGDVILVKGSRVAGLEVVSAAVRDRAGDRPHLQAEGPA